MKTIVFAFHYIRDELYNNPGIHPFSTKNFLELIEYCQSQGEIVNPENFFKKKLNPNKISFLLTFDDGLVDHYKILPILNKNNIKGIFFLCSGYYNNQEMLTIHKIHHIRSKIDERTFNQYFFDELNIIKFNYKIYADKASKFYLYDHKKNALMKYLLNFVLSKKVIDKLIYKISCKHKINFNDIAKKLYLTIEQIKKIHSFGNVIGLHGHTHSKLNNIGKISKIEIEINKKFLSKYDLDNKFNSFAYPYGREIALPKNLNKFLKNNNLGYCFTMEKKISDNNYRKENISRFSPNNYKSTINKFLKIYK